MRPEPWISRKKTVDRIGEPDELQPASRERARRDFRAWVIGQEAAVLDPADQRLAAPVFREGAEIGGDDVLGRTVEGRLVRPALAASARNLRLVVAGEEPDVLGPPHLEGDEPALHEVLGVGGRDGRRLRTDPRPVARRPELRSRLGGEARGVPPGEAAAHGLEGVEGREGIGVPPARQGVEGDL